MTHDAWIEMIQAEFFDTITSSGSLNELADRAYSFLGNPLMLTNERGEIFSKSQFNPPYNDALWEEFDAKGYVPKEKSLYISAAHFSGKMCNNRLLVFEPAYISHRLMLYQQKVSATFTLRAIMLESKRPFSSDDEAVFELFAKTAAYFLKGTRLVREFNSNSFEFFLHELISGHIDTEKNEADITSYLFLKPGDRLVMLVVGQKHGNVAPISLQEARTGLQSAFTNGISFIFEGRIVIFVNLREQGGELMRCLDRATAYMRKNKLSGAVSRYFESFHNISELYRQTEACLCMGSRLNPRGAVYFVGDLMVTYLLSQLDADQVGQLCYLPILELLDRQQEAYLPTLYAYVISLGNMAQAAKLLGVHYNTIKYRIQKITQVIGGDLDAILPALYVSIKSLFLTRKDYMSDCFDMELFLRRQRRRAHEQ